MTLKIDCTHSEYTSISAKGIGYALWDENKTITGINGIESGNKSKVFQIAKSILNKELFLQYERFKSWFWVISALVLLTPVKYAFILSVMIGASAYYSKKFLFSSLNSLILSDPVAFDEMKKLELFYIVEIDTLGTAKFRE